MIREVYERAIANVPPAEEKRYWQRYIYLWINYALYEELETGDMEWTREVYMINYALYEELETGDMERTREVYMACLNLIPHKKFSFAKIWLLAAQFELRQKNLKGARRILGNAIGKALKDKIFKKYIEIELQLGQIDRCRILYEKYLEWAPANCYAWSKYAELERSLSEKDRARAIFELAIAQPALDMPELLWKNLISLRAPELKEERAMLLEEWLNMEGSFGSLGDVSIVQKKLPRKVKRRRKYEDVAHAGYEYEEEYFDYVFPDEVAMAPTLKIIEAAYKWKKHKVGSDED